MHFQCILEYQEFFCLFHTQNLVAMVTHSDLGGSLQWYSDFYTLKAATTLFSKAPVFTLSDTNIFNGTFMPLNLDVYFNSQLFI